MPDWLKWVLMGLGLVGTAFQAAPGHTIVHQLSPVLIGIAGAGGALSTGVPGAGGTAGPDRKK